VQLYDPVGGSRTEYAVPIYWRAESNDGPLPAAVQVGEPPCGWTETVAYAEDPPSDDLLGVDGLVRGGGFTFWPSQLSTETVLRSNHDSVDHATFRREGAAECDRA